MAEIKLPPTVTPVIGPTANNKSFELFQSANEVVPLAASDKTSVEALQKHLGASIGTASVVAGVLKISLSKAADSRCSLSARSLK